MDSETISYLSITDSPSMSVGFRWDGHIFWNWYARYLDAVDVGNLQRIAQLDKQLGDYQVNIFYWKKKNKCKKIYLFKIIYTKLETFFIFLIFMYDRE